MSREALIVYGGWDGHTPKESAQVFKPLLEADGFKVTLSTSMDVYADAGLMASMSLIVPIWTMGEIKPEQSAGLQNAVRSGVGLAGFHGGIIDSFRMDTGYQFMTGGQWVAHPGNNLPSYRVTLRDKHHPITRGLSDFTLSNTEQYYCHIDPAVHVLCETAFTSGPNDQSDLYPLGTVMPYAWTRAWGKGRVFVAAWGHSFKDFDEPTARELVRRGMNWAARS